MNNFMIFNPVFKSDLSEFFPAQENSAPQTPKSDRVRMASSVQENRFLTNSNPVCAPREDVKRVCIGVVNVFESGRPEGDYSCVSVYEDGPRGRDGRCLRQLTYGRTQTTEYGLLPELLREYVSREGAYAKEIDSKLWLLRSGSLAVDEGFIDLLRRAGGDPVMRGVQDSFFDRMYWEPAECWWREHGFATGLGMLVVYDSFVHSGSVPNFLRRRFDELVPVCGGNEREWLREYVGARGAWLKNHANRILRGTVYRTNCLAREIERENWDLEILPINANGVEVS